MIRTVLMALASGLLLADSQEPVQQPAEPVKDKSQVALNLVEHDRELPGQWLLTLPQGAKYQAVLRPMGGNRFRLEKAVRFSGDYEIHDNRLLLVAPLSPVDAGFVWELRLLDELALVGQPNNSGNDYTGTTLKRQSAGAPAVPSPVVVAPLPLTERISELRGRWLLTLPQGAKYDTVLRPLAEKRFRLEKAVRFSGVYEIQDNRLLLVQPPDTADGGFAWQMRAPDELVLVAQSPKVENDYRGATLKRYAEDGPLPSQPQPTPALPSAAVEAPPRDRRLFYLLSALIVAFVLMSIAFGVWLATRQRRDDFPAKPKPRKDTPPSTSLVCPSCAAALKARANQGGKKIKCPRCGEVVMVPKAPAGKSTGSSAQPRA